MSDPTNNNLAYALLDQKIAGLFHDRPYAYVDVMREKGKPWGVGIAVENESGYHPVDGPDVQWDKRDDAYNFCVGMNQHIGLDDQKFTMIVASTMRSR